MNRLFDAKEMIRQHIGKYYKTIRSLTTQYALQTQNNDDNSEDDCANDDSKENQ